MPDLTFFLKKSMHKQQVDKEIFFPPIFIEGFKKIENREDVR